jgi:hypothetical protein
MQTRDFDHYLSVLEVFSDPSLLDVKGSLLKGWEYASPLQPLSAPVMTLPEIVFDSDGWSNELRASDGSYFHIYRLRSGSKFVLKGKDARTFSAVLPFAGALALAASRVLGRMTPVNTGIVTEDDRRTNYGAF